MGGGPGGGGVENDSSEEPKQVSPSWPPHGIIWTSTCWAPGTCLYGSTLTIRGQYESTMTQ